MRLLLLIASLVPVALRAAGLPDGFVYLDDVIPEIRLELRYYGTDNFVGQRVNGYEQPVGILTEAAAAALKDVQDDLREFRLGLKVFDAYRPQRAVDHFMQWAQDPAATGTKARYYPNVAKGNLVADGYIAAQSGHSRGSTVDVTLVSLDTDAPQELDMGTGWDYFGPESWGKSPAATPVQRAHRMLLRAVMTRHGFRPLQQEWWHFTLADEPFPGTYFDFPVRRH